MIFVGVVALLLRHTPYAGMIRIRLRVDTALRVLSARLARTPLVGSIVSLILDSYLREVNPQMAQGLHHSVSSSARYELNIPALHWST